jgi:hypothetical protein
MAPYFGVVAGVEFGLIRVILPGDAPAVGIVKIVVG